MNSSQTALTDALVAARRGNRTLDATPWLDTLETGAQAYEVQDAVAAALGWFDGQPVPRAWKSGGGSRTATLTHAPLPPAGVRQSPADFSDLVFHMPGIEAEIALRLGQDVTPAQAAKLDHENAAALIDAMAVSVEIVDARWQDLSSTPALLRLADSQVHGALVIGEWKPYAAVDWASQRCETKIGDAEVVVREGTHPLADPAWLLPIWLRHITSNGQTAPAGTVVTTGSWVGVLPSRRGDQVTAEFPGIGAVRLSV
ncbi:fumarylacetoacetate hydrolase family protein [Variovorax sp. NFACC27]|uniref:fumarylacetoacetate hydrolase family protein n=1 Tax=unclassified Variovorax TaxID=663243 RepID=UPI00089C1EC3|nr:2-keto-4-pentenoate hydratase [Variovorax sp. NFACC28]SEG94773.1 2-keto-4-pentenoate hydratase [Variovorax sp. NFACC29]SFD72322.1 2-keto-4-pentenoate hydratase [Variovorax sp. NFACC26]SFG85586.1 2-keto-4-pentenoate hydratase [Variovorax sp. NFACC27]